MKNTNNTLIWTGQKEWEPWTVGDQCPNCGSDEIEYNTRLMLASYPPKQQLRCKKCGHHFSSGGCTAIKMTTDDVIDRTYLDELFKHDQSILGIPQVGDWPPAPTPCDPIGTPQPLNYGWICPKCGRCLAPHVNSCPHCSGPTTINITY